MIWKTPDIFRRINIGESKNQKKAQKIFTDVSHLSYLNDRMVLIKQISFPGIKTIKINQADFTFQRELNWLRAPEH
jgi:hypothetical protein